MAPKRRRGRTPSGEWKDAYWCNGCGSEIDPVDAADVENKWCCKTCRSPQEKFVLESTYAEYLLRKEEV